jgi:hypothetical protein
MFVGGASQHENLRAIDLLWYLIGVAAPRGNRDRSKPSRSISNHTKFLSRGNTEPLSESIQVREAVNNRDYKCANKQSKINYIYSSRTNLIKK